MPVVTAGKTSNPIQPNATSLDQNRRNWQRLAQIIASGEISSNVQVTAPITNTGGDIGLAYNPAQFTVTGGELYLIPPTIAQVLAAGNNAAGETLTNLGTLNATTVIEMAAGGTYQYNGVVAVQAQTTLKNWYFGNSGNLTGTGTGSNTAVGSGALAALTTGYFNTAIGANAMAASTTANQSVAIGEGALPVCTTGNGNIAIGHGTALHLTTGQANVLIGGSALGTATTASFNVCLGTSGVAGNITTGSYNTCVGPAAGNGIITGSYNTYIGGGNFSTPNTSNNVFLADGQGNLVLRFDSSQNGTVYGVFNATSRLLVGGASDDGATPLQVSGPVTIQSNGLYLGLDHQYYSYNGIWFNILPANTTISNYSILGISSGLYTLINATSEIDLRISNNDCLQIKSSGHVIVGSGSDNGTDQLQVGGSLYISDTKILSTGTSFTNGAGSGLGTLTNAPAAGNPTKWIPINDNGTTRYIPAW